VNSSKTKVTDHPSKLRHYRFAQKYIELNFNGTQAYLAVYGEEYKATKGKEMSDKLAASSASRMLTNVKVQQYIEQITEQAFQECQISINSVLSKYKRWSESNITDVVKWENVVHKDKNGNDAGFFRLTLRDMNDIPPEIQECIESVSEGKEGFKVTMVSKKGANDMLFKYLGLDKQDTGKHREIHLHLDKIDEAL